MVINHIKLGSIKDCRTSLKNFVGWSDGFISNYLHYISTNNCDAIKKFWNVFLPFQDCVFYYEAGEYKIPLILRKNEMGMYFFEPPYSNNLSINKTFFAQIPEEDKFVLYSGYCGSPVVYKDCDTFEAYMRKHRKSYVSILFGAKSKKVKWDFCRVYSPEYEQLKDQICGLWTEHCEHIMSVSDKPQSNWSTCSDTWNLEDDTFGIVYATDLETNKVVCAMQIGDIGGMGSCGIIALSHDEKYKPYALVSSAQYWAINYFFYQSNSYNSLDLGWNGDALGLYKKDLAHEFIDLYTLNDVSADEMNEFMNPILEKYK